MTFTNEKLQRNECPRATEEVVVEFSDVSKWYGPVIALSRISVKFGRGITGLLGPNGAGKTTLIELMLGRLRPDRGSVRVLGCDPWRSRRVFHRVGYCPDTDGFYEAMSGHEFVYTMARLCGFSSAESRRRAADCLDLVGMEAHAARPISEYSKGMKQRIKLAAALVHDPELLVLDEPLNGLDPFARRQMMELLRRLGSRGLAIIVSSHILSEVEAMTNRIVLIHQGLILADGAISEIRALIANQPLTYRIETPEPRQLARELVQLEEIQSLALDEADRGQLIIRTSDALRLCQQLQRLAADGQYLIRAATPTDDSLEAVFRYLVK